MVDYGGGGGWDRTNDQQVMSPLLYLLMLLCQAYNPSEVGV